MFIGRYIQSLDEKSSLTLPAHFGEFLTAGGFVTQGFDRNIWVLTDAAFQEIYKRVMTMNIADPVARLLLRKVLGNASPLEMDQSGRIHIPINLREYANVNSEAVLVGQGDYFEVWAPALWDNQEIQLQDAETNVDRFIELNIATR